MTYTEFIKEIENNIAKANCNKLNIGEYEEKQKQIYKQIRAEAIEEFVRFANTMPTVKEENGTIRPMWLEEMAEQLKAGVKNEN